MASPPHPTIIENLPHEVLSDIFIRLLAKQLAQMRCICKALNALLSHSSFIKSHLRRSIHNNNDFLLFVHFFDCDRFATRCSRSPVIELTNFIRLPVISQIKYDTGFVIGSINGLICFAYVSNRDYIVHIFNPSLSAVLTLPTRSLASHEFRFGFGFGFDPNCDDCKVVKLTSLYRTRMMAPQCEVYSMRKGFWESTSQMLPLHIRRIAWNNSVCVDGHLHWLGYTDTLKTIVGFDLGAETFREIPLPDSLLHHHGSRVDYLGILGGKLCVMTKIRGGKCEVWVMDEYGVAESWVKHHLFSQFSGSIIPYGFTSRNEFLYTFDGDYNRFALCDQVAAKTNVFKIMLRRSYISHFPEYVDSFVWIEPSNRLQM